MALIVLPEHQVHGVTFLLALEKLAVTQYCELLVHLRRRKLESLHQLRTGSFAFLLDVTIDLLL